MEEKTLPKNVACLFPHAAAGGGCIVLRLQGSIGAAEYSILPYSLEIRPLSTFCRPRRYPALDVTPQILLHKFEFSPPQKVNDLVFMTGHNLAEIRYADEMDIYRNF